MYEQHVSWVIIMINKAEKQLGTKRINYTVGVQTKGKHRGDSQEGNTQ